HVVVGIAKQKQNFGLQGGVSFQQGQSDPQFLVGRSPLLLAVVRLAGEVVRESADEFLAVVPIGIANAFGLGLAVDHLGQLGRIRDDLVGLFALGAVAIDGDEQHVVVIGVVRQDLFGKRDGAVGIVHRVERLCSDWHDLRYVLTLRIAIVESEDQIN